MSDGEVGHDHNVDGVRGLSEVSRDGFLDIVLELIERAALGEDVFAEAASAPILAVKVGLELYQHRGTIAHRRRESQKISPTGSWGSVKPAAPAGSPTPALSRAAPWWFHLTHRNFHCSIGPQYRQISTSELFQSIPIRIPLLPGGNLQQLIRKALLCA